MLVNIDAKQLEWVCAAYLSKDKVAYDEINAGVDLHSINQERFGLPTRTLAKVFLFRLIYGGSAFAYVHDPEFAHVSSSESFWQRVIDTAYDKYKGLGKWHESLVSEVVRTGSLTVDATKRTYHFTKERGEWPRPKILNYPVQGLGHDLMAVYRTALKSVRTTLGLSSLLTSTVHDSILFDCPAEETQIVCQLALATTDQVPLDFKTRFGVEFDLPFRVEVKYGPNWGPNMEIYDANSSR